MIQGDTSKRRTGSLFVKKQQRPPATQTLMESVRGMITNFSYGLEGLKMTYFCGQRTKDSPKAHFLGKEIKEEVTLQLHQQLLWFTYRKNIPITASLHSDVGWGCLIRVAQMAWAHSLQRHFSMLQKRVERNYIITPFLEGRGKDFKYGLLRFVEKGHSLWGIKPGQWYTMTQAATILEALHEENPLKGSQKLVIRVFHETVHIKQLLDILGATSCRCILRRVDCFLCQQAHKSPKQSYFLKSITKMKQTSPIESTRHIMLVVTLRLGLKVIGKDNFKILLQLMSLPIFNGCLGGTPEKARFLTGFHEQRISYLDPHYVQSAIDQLSLSMRSDHFMCKEVRYMTREELHPELALCFYIASPNDLQMLVEAIDRAKTEQPFIRYEWESSGEYQILGQDERRQTELKENFEDLEESFGDLNASFGVNSSFLME